MAIRNWTYTGNISSFSSEKNYRGERIISSVVLRDMRDYNKAPVMLNVSAALMAYINDIESNDDEERYMRKEFVYDDILCIRKIRILNKDGKVCKIIREWDEMNWCAEIIGPVKRITSESQNELENGAATCLVMPEDFKA